MPFLFLPTLAGWNVKTTTEELLEVFKDFQPQYKSLLALAQDVTLWQMRVVPELPAWTRENACLLGDAAHATFPSEYLDQGM